MKRIITCCDGTWNRPGETDNGTLVMTNVQLMYKAILPEGFKDGLPVRQVKFYETGVGSSTYDQIDRFFGGIKGFGIDKKIKDIYSFILMNYDKGDELFLFGFSRGAYTARSVAGFIRNCGILKPENIHLVDMAYCLYRDRNEYTVPDSDFMKSFRENYCVEDISKIKFIGVWDTVGSLGMPFRFLKLYNNEKYKFHDVKLSSYIENAYHAMAIDEHRKLFEPTLWEISENSQNQGQHVEQKWFSGAHSNVGGGYKNTCLSDIAYNWMAEKAAENGLELKLPEDCKLNPDQDGELIESRNSFYKLWRTNLREIWQTEREKKPISDPVAYSITNESIHESALERYKNVAKYKPENLKKAIEKYKLKFDSAD